MVPAAYAGGDDDDGNKNKAEDDSLSIQQDCDENDVSGSSPAFRSICESFVSGFTAND